MAAKSAGFMGFSIQIFAIFKATATSNRSENLQRRLRGIHAIHLSLVPKRRLLADDALAGKWAARCQVAMKRANSGSDRNAGQQSKCEKSQNAGFAD